MAHLSYVSLPSRSKSSSLLHHCHLSQCPHYCTALLSLPTPSSTSSYTLTWRLSLPENPIKKVGGLDMEDGTLYLVGILSKQEYQIEAEMRRVLHSDDFQFGVLHLFRIFHRAEHCGQENAQSQVSSSALFYTLKNTRNYSRSYCCPTAVYWSS